MRRRLRKIWNLSVRQWVSWPRRNFPDYVSSWVLEGGYAAVVMQQWGTGKSRVNDLPPPASTIVFWYVQLSGAVGAMFRMVKRTYAVDPKMKKNDTVCIPYAAVQDLMYVHEVEQQQWLVPVRLLVLGTDEVWQQSHRLDIDFTQIVPIDTTPIEEGLCFYNPRVPGDNILYEHCLGTWEDWFRVGLECLMEDFLVLLDTISTYNDLYPLRLNQVKDLRVTRCIPDVSTEAVWQKYIKLVQGFMKDAKAHGLTILPCITMMVGEASVYNAHQVAHIQARREQAAKQRWDKRGDSAKLVSFQVDEPAEEEGQQLGAHVPWRLPHKYQGAAQTLPPVASPWHRPPHWPCLPHQQHQQRCHHQHPIVRALRSDVVWDCTTA